jgi:hypothetical protein
VNKYQIGLAVVALAASFATNANAASVNNVGSGSVATVGAPCCPAGQVFGNIILDAAGNRSSYLIFDTNSLASQLGGQQVGSATLTLTQPGFYSSADATETLTLWNYSGNVAALSNYSFQNPPNATDAATIRDDLRSGTSFGTAVISKPANGALPNITITLNADAIAAINNSLDSSVPLVFGLFSDTLTGQQLLFQTGGGGAGIAQLDVSPVPLPAALPLFATVLAGGGLIAWRRKRKAAAAA